MSNEYTERFLESRYSEYIEQGYSPKDSEIMAHEDLEHDQYDHVPEEGGNNE
jgi:hypothetical protein